ncbi:MAG: response regulator transcription factor [Agriterribacter sp.]
MNSKLITLAIADDHTLFCQCLANTLQSTDKNLSIIFEAENGSLLLEKLSRRQPDVLLLDMKMPELNGINALKTIYEKYPAVRVLVLSAFLDETYVAQCLELGINGYLTKHMGIEEIIKAIYTAHNNDIYISNIINNALLKSYFSRYNKNTHTLLPQFSDKEIFILNQLKLGKSLDEISKRLFLSRRSVELKINIMKEKTGTKTTISLIFHAHQRNLLDE